MRQSTEHLLLRWAGGIGLVALTFSQEPGQIVADTKLDLVVDPGAFLRSSLSAWDAQAGFGQLQNQAYGYLFPMGSTFWLGHAAGLPGWVVQRAWWALLLLSAYTGFLLLSDRLGIGRPGARAVGALAYALGPRVLTVLGPISAEALPLALLPWVLVPLVTGSTRGSPRRAAARSGLAIACIGGINAAATLAVLVVPVLWLLTREKGPRRRALAAWWSGAVVLAVAWWFLPLLVLGRFAFPFLDNIETSSTTTSVASMTNVLRGADHWVGFLARGGVPVWQAGWTIAADPWVVAATAVVAVLGLWGLRWSATPERLFLSSALLAGCLCLGLGYTGPGGSPLGPWVQTLLDGPLAAFRNVHKFDPVLRLALTLGLTVTLGELPRLARRFAAALPGEEGAWFRARPRAGPAVAVAVVAGVLLVSSGPAWSGRIPNQGSFEAVPAWWEEAAGWLAQQDGRTLLEPASGFGEYDWGRPWDEPLQALAQAPWAVRGAAPLGSPGLTRYLDAVEQQVSTGRPSDELAPALARAGVRQVVLRNDLALAASATPVAAARASLQHSPGLELVRTFGPPVQVSGTITRGHTLEVYAVTVATGDPRVTLMPAEEVSFTGGPEAAIRAGSDAHPWLDPTQASSGSVVVTDTLPVRQVNMGAAVTMNSSETLDGSSPELDGRRLRDIDPYDQDVTRTVVGLDGGWASASSTTTDPYSGDYRGPVGGPYAAIDGSTATAWIPSLSDADPTWELRLSEPQQLTAITLDFSDLPAGVLRPAGVVVASDSASQEVPVGSDRVRVPLTGTATSVSVELVRPKGGAFLVGVTEIDLAGAALHPSLVVAPAPDADAAWSYRVEALSRPECVQVGAAWTCSSAMARPGSERAGVIRTFVGATTGPPSLTAEAVALAGPPLDRLLDRSFGRTVTGSSQLFRHPAARPGAAVDGDSATAWVPDPSDVNPTLTIALPKRETIDGVAFLAGPSSSPQVAGLVIRDASGQVRTVESDGSSPTSFKPLASDRFRVTFRLRHASGSAVGEAFALSELTLNGLRPAAGPVVRLPCGSGPTVTLDGRRLRTGVQALPSDLVAGRPVPLRVCDTTVALAPGEHQLDAMPSSSFAVTRVDLGAPAPSTVPSERVVVSRWDDSTREVAVPRSSAARLLVTTEGANRGWRASLGGRELVPVQVDGWRQAWRIPAGTAGVVVMTFAPEAWHLGGLAVGAVLLLALLVLAVVAGSDRRDLCACDARDVSPTVWRVAGVVAAALLAGGWGVLAWGVAWLVLLSRLSWSLVALAWVLLTLASAALWIPLGSLGGSTVLLQVLGLVLVLSAAGPAPPRAQHPVADEPV